MKTVVRANKQLRIPDDRLEAMRRAGFAEIDAVTGEIINPPEGSQVQIDALKAEIAALKRENAQLKSKAKK